jgi:hypothetical protein
MTQFMTVAIVSHGSPASDYSMAMAGIVSSAAASSGTASLCCRRSARGFTPVVFDGSRGLP